MKYKTEKEILELVRKFEDGTVSRKDWGHPEHLIVAFYYCSNNEFETALNKMRGGIFNLLRAFEVDLSKEMPYHETLTVFWMRTVNNFICSKKDKSVVEICHEIIEKFDKNYPLNFYTREFLFSDNARKRYLEPNI